MNILFLTQWFEPEPTLKGLVFARALAERGHHVEVLTGFPNYPGGRLYAGYHVKPLQREVVGGIPITRVALYPSHDRSAIGRLANYTSFAVSAATVGAALIRQPEVVYAYHPPATIAFPAMVIKAIRQAPFVLDIQDMWPDTLQATGMIENRMALRFVSRLCRLGYRSAARIIVSSPGFKEKLIDRGVTPEKIEVIYNWCDESAITTRDADAPILEEAGLEGRFNVVFAGTMGHAQALSSVLHAASLVAAKAPHVQFVFVGGGIQLAALKAEAEQRALSNVRFLPVRPAVEVGPLLATADILLVHLRDDPLFAITIPSKTHAYMAAGRPILMAVRGDAATVVRDAGAGICVPPEDPDALAIAICELSNRSPDDLTQMGARGRAHYLRHFSLSAGVDRFEAVFQAISGRPIVPSQQSL